MDLFALLRQLVDEGGSDLFLSSGAPPHMKVQDAKGGKRKVAVDVLINTPDIAELLRAGDIEKVRASAQKYSWMGAAA